MWWWWRKKNDWNVKKQKKEEGNERNLSLVVVEKASLTSSSIKNAGYERQASVNRNFNHFWTIKQQHNYVTTQWFKVIGELALIPSINLFILISVRASPGVLGIRKSENDENPPHVIREIKSNKDKGLCRRRCWCVPAKGDGIPAQKRII